MGLKNHGGANRADQSTLHKEILGVLGLRLSRSLGFRVQGLRVSEFWKLGLATSGFGACILKVLEPAWDL